MRKLHLLFSNKIELEDKRIMFLDYNLTEKSSELDEKAPLYGVQITRRLGDDIESDEVSGISYSKEDITSLIKKLFQNEVTPISMVEIIDDLVTQGIF